MYCVSFGQNKQDKRIQRLVTWRMSVFFWDVAVCVNCDFFLCGCRYESFYLGSVLGPLMFFSKAPYTTAQSQAETYLCFGIAEKQDDPRFISQRPCRSQVPKLGLFRQTLWNTGSLETCTGLVWKD